MLWYQELDWFSKLWKKKVMNMHSVSPSPAQTLQQTLKQLV